MGSAEVRRMAQMVAAAATSGEVVMHFNGVDCGQVMITSETVVEDPTPEKIEKAIAALTAGGFKGRLRMKTPVPSQLVIVKEEMIEPRRLLHG